MAILAEFCHFSAKIAPYVEISIILAGFFVEKNYNFLDFFFFGGHILQMSVSIPARSFT